MDAIGARDERLWAEFRRKPSSNQERAKRALRVLQVFHGHFLEGCGIATATDLTCEEMGCSRAYIYRMRAKVKGVSFANWPPVLAAHFKGGRKKADMSDEAWKHFRSLMAGIRPMPILAAYRRAAEEAERYGWNWPSYGTVRSRWKATLAIWDGP